MGKSYRANSEESVVQHRPRSRKVRDEDAMELDSSGVTEDDFQFLRASKKDDRPRKK